MRAGLTITNREVKRVEKSLNALEKRYAKGKVPQETYTMEKGRLLSELNRPRAERSNLSRNPKAWWKRNEVNLSAAPVGYWNHHSRNTVGHRRPLVNQNKIRAALISDCGDGYWNSNDFQQAIRVSANNSNEIKQNEAFDRSFFEETVMASYVLGKTESQNLWNEISNSPQVVRALENLSKTIDKTVKNMMKNGVSESNAIQAVRNQAVTSGKAITSAGYNPEDAAQLIKMVACGQMSVQQAKNSVALDINNTSHAVANAPAVPFRNNFDPYAMTPVGRPRRGDPSLKTWQNNYNPYNMTPTGVSLEALMQSANQLQQQFDLENNPTARNEISFALNNLQQEINRRQEALDETPTFETMTTIDVPSQGRGYNPTKNYRAPNSTMQQTVRAMANGPSIATVVKDIFTVQANVYFDWMSGSSIEFLDNGTYKSADRNSNPVAVFPKGEWTIFAQSKSSLPTMKQIKQAITYALSSPLWAPADRAYLEYLSGLTNSKVNELEAIVNDVLPVVNQINNSNNNAIANVINNSNNAEQVVNEIANYKEKLDQMTTSEVRQHMFERIYKIINTLAPMIPVTELEYRIQTPGALFDTYMRFVSEQEFAMDTALSLHVEELYGTLDTTQLISIAIDFAQQYGNKLNSVAQRHLRHLADSGFMLQFAQNAPSKEEYFMMVKLFEILTNGYFAVMEELNSVNNSFNNNGTMPNNLVPNNNNNHVGNGLPNNLVRNNALPNNVINNMPPNNGAPMPPNNGAPMPPNNGARPMPPNNMPNMPPNNGAPMPPNNMPNMPPNNGAPMPPNKNIPNNNLFIEHKHWSADGNTVVYAKNSEMNKSLHNKGYAHNRMANNPRNNPPENNSPKPTPFPGRPAPPTRPVMPGSGGNSGLVPISPNGGGGFSFRPGFGMSVSTTTSTSSSHPNNMPASVLATSRATNKLSQSFLRGTLGLSTSTSTSSSSSHPRHLPNDPRTTFRTY